MPCSGCAQRREQLTQAAKAAKKGDVGSAAAVVADIARSMSQDAQTLAKAAAQRLSAAHARLRR